MLNDELANELELRFARNKDGEFFEDSWDLCEFVVENLPTILTALRSTDRDAAEVENERLREELRKMAEHKFSYTSVVGIAEQLFAWQQAARIALQEIRP